MKKIKLILKIFSLYIITQLSYGFNAPTNNTLTLQLSNQSSHTLTYTDVRKTNIGNSFSVTPTVILPGGSAIVIGTATAYADLAGNLPFQDEQHYTHLLHIIDPRMINFKNPTFSIYNDKLISFVKFSSFTKNENQEINSIAYSDVTVVIRDTAHSATLSGKNG